MAVQWRSILKPAEILHRWHGACYAKKGGCMERIFVKTDRLTIETWRRELSEALCLLSQDAGNRKFLPDEVFQTLEEAQAMGYTACKRCH